MELLPPPQSGLLLTPELLDAAARRSGHARALGVVVVVGRNLRPADAPSVNCGSMRRPQ